MGARYVETARTAGLSVGVYTIPAGALDPQRPHGEDEVYVVRRGRARFRLEDVVRDVGPGDVLVVPARAAHRFEDVTEDLDVVVVFAPPEGARAR